MSVCWLVVGVCASLHIKRVCQSYTRVNSISGISECHCQLVIDGPYQKIPDIYFLRSCSLPNFITIPSPINIQFVVDVFVLYVILYLLLYCLLCYLVLRPQSWINSTLLYSTLPTKPMSLHAAAPTAPRKSAPVNEGYHHQPEQATLC